MSKLDAIVVLAAIAILALALALVENAKADCRKAGGVPVRGAGITPVECIKQTKEPTHDR